MGFRGFWTVSLVICMGLVPVLAFGLDADIYGYTKAADVTGNLSVSTDQEVLELTGFSCDYYHPLEVYISRGYDPAGAEMVGVIPAGFKGDLTFSPVPRITGEDMVLLKVPGWTVPLGLGLFGN